MNCNEDILIYPPHCSKYLWYICWLSVVSGLYAIYQKHYLLSLIPFGVFLLGTNYWKNPESNCWRRYVDIGFVFASIICNTYISFYAENGKYLNLFNSLAIMCYPISCVFYNYGYIEISTFFHICLHVFANIALYYLYSGKIEYPYFIKKLRP